MIFSVNDFECLISAIFCKTCFFRSFIFQRIIFFNLYFSQAEQRKQTTQTFIYITKKNRPINFIQDGCVRATIWFEGTAPSTFKSILVDWHQTLFHKTSKYRQSKKKVCFQLCMMCVSCNWLTKTTHNLKIAFVLALITFVGNLIKTPPWRPNADTNDKRLFIFPYSVSFFVYFQLLFLHRNTSNRYNWCAT